MILALSKLSKCITPKLTISSAGLRNFSVGENLFRQNNNKPPGFDDELSPYHILVEEQKYVPDAMKIHHPSQPNLQVKRSSTWGLPILSPKDCERRVIFAEKMLSILDNNPRVLDSIVFSDEGNFWPAPKKPIGPKKKWKQKLYNESAQIPTIVWCGLTSKEIIGPYFFNAYVTESSYMKMLRKFFLPQLTCLNYPLESTWFQQDGAPWHRTKKCLSFLESAFQDRLISNGCPLAWPPRSQDLTPLDYFFWDYLKARLVPFHPKNVQDLKECICFESKVVEPSLLENVVNEFCVRLELCRKANGGRFNVGKPKDS